MCMQCRCACVTFCSLSHRFLECASISFSCEDVSSIFLKPLLHAQRRFRTLCFLSSYGSISFTHSVLLLIFPLDVVTSCFNIWVLFFRFGVLFFSMCLLLLLFLLSFPVVVRTQLRRTKRAPAGLASHCGSWSERDRNKESALGGICLLPPPMESSRHTEVRRSGQTKNS